MVVTQIDIREAVRALGLRDKALCVHSSLSSFGWVEGGATAILDALLGEGCTIMVPAHFYEGAIAPPVHLRPPRNGFDYVAWDTKHPGEKLPGDAFVYTPESNEISSQWMGALPTAVLQRPGRVRGNHPMGSFAAIGPLARVLVDGQTPEDDFAPIRTLAALGGFAVLMGVGLKSLTLLHYAEVRAGRNMFMRWANGPEGIPIPIFGGGCSRGFNKLELALDHLTREAVVGSSRWLVLPAEQTIASAAAAIRDQPEITHCGSLDCLECNDAVLGGPILATLTNWNQDETDTSTR